MVDTLMNASAASVGQEVLLLVARICLALMFIGSASDKFRLDPKEVDMIRGLGLPAPEGIERLVGLCELAGVAMIVFGVGARLGAGALGAFVLFTTLTFLRYWSVKGPPDVVQNIRNVFYGNIAVVGGLIYIAALGPGRLAILPGY